MWIMLGLLCHWCHGRSQCRENRNPHLILWIILGWLWSQWQWMQWRVNGQRLHFCWSPRSCIWRRLCLYRKKWNMPKLYPCFHCCQFHWCPCQFTCLNENGFEHLTSQCCHWRLLSIIILLRRCLHLGLWNCLESRSFGRWLWNWLSIWIRILVG